MPPRLFYGLFMLLALAVFLWLRQLRAQAAGTARRCRGGSRLGLALAAFIGGTLGAKLPFALAQ